MKPIYTAEYRICIYLLIRRLRLCENTGGGGCTRDALIDASWHGIRRRAKRRICKQPRYTHRSPRIKRLSREAIREQLARMIHGGWRASATCRAIERKERGGSKTREKEGDTKGKRGRLQERLSTVYTYIMQMVPIISEVYNRSINLLTGRKGSGVLGVTIRGGSVPFHKHHRVLVRTR